MYGRKNSKNIFKATISNIIVVLFYIGNLGIIYNTFFASDIILAIIEIFVIIITNMYYKKYGEEMSIKRKILIGILILTLIGFLIIIFTLSSEDGVKSKNTSREITKMATKPIKTIQELEPKEKEIVLDKMNNVTRKLAHFSLYMLVGLLTMLILRLSVNDNTKKNIIMCLIVGFIYAVSDEIHQMFVSGRTGLVMDVVIDMLGVIVGVFIVNFCAKKYINKMQKVL